MIQDQLREAWNAKAKPVKQAHEYGSTIAIESFVDVPRNLKVEPVEDSKIPLFVEVEGHPYYLEIYLRGKAFYRLDSQ